LVNRDDLVSRLSLFNAREFAADIKASRPRWQPLFERDKGAYKEKAKSLWAPEQRGKDRSVKRSPTDIMKRLSVRSGDGSEPDPAEGRAASRRSKRGSKERVLPHRLVVPGITAHVYTWRGTQQAALIDYRFPGLRRIQASESIISDHRMKKIHAVFRSVRAVRAIGSSLSPPEWQSVKDHHARGMYVECGVCNYFVGWMHTGDSEAVEVRATFNCFACGKIVCKRCSEERCPLPELGILNPVRVCDVCFSRLNLEVDSAAGVCAEP